MNSKHKRLALAISSFLALLLLMSACATTVDEQAIAAEQGIASEADKLPDEPLMPPEAAQSDPDEIMADSLISSPRLPRPADDLADDLEGADQQAQAGLLIDRPLPQLDQLQDLAGLQDIESRLPEEAAAEQAEKTPAAAPPAAQAAPPAPQATQKTVPVTPPAAAAPPVATSDLHDAPPAMDAVNPSESLQGYANEAFTVVIPGDGWIYLGERNGNMRVQFVSRANDGSGNTIFAFIATKPGQYDLGFQRQDLAKGVTERSLVQASVGEERPPPPASIASEGTPADSSADPLTQQSATQPAPPQQNQPAPPQQNQQNAPPISPQLEPAAVFAPTPFDFAEALKQENIADLRRSMSAIAPRVLIEELGLQAALDSLRLLSRNGTLEDASELLAYLELNDNDEAHRPQILFYLGSFYEEPANRNYRKALAYYDELQNKYPYHELAGPAGVRSRFIRRHFFDIR